MFFVLLLPIFVFLIFPSPVKAQIPLFHQLIAAYQPQKHLVSVNPQILGTNTIADNTKDQVKNLEKLTPLNSTSLSTGTPPNIGGDGPVITIAFLGDSMVQTLDSQIIEKSLTKYYPGHKFNILNYGLGASDIEYGLFRLKNNYQHQGTDIPSLFSQKPDIIVIESFAYNNFGNTQSGIDRQWLALGAITTDIKNTLPNSKILLTATIAPHSVVFGNGSQFSFTSLEKIEKTNTIKLYLQNLVNFATSQNFPLANAFTRSLINNQGNLNFISTTDHIHPSSQGATFFADTIASAISRYLLI